MSGTLELPAGAQGIRMGRVPAGGYTIRTACPGDAPLIREFICGLSVRTQYFRFFTAVSPPSPGLLRALAGEVGRADILLVIDHGGGVVGHGMAVDAEASATRSADIGLVISDCWQNQGLGSALLSLLTDRAAARGVRALQLDVLPDNLRMLGMIERRWPDARRTRTPDSISITADIARPDLDNPVLPGHLLAAALLDCAARGSYAGRTK